MAFKTFKTFEILQEARDSVTQKKAMLEIGRNILVKSRNLCSRNEQQDC